MSVPYLIHKEDADEYDACLKELEPKRKAHLKQIGRNRERYHKGEITNEENYQLDRPLEEDFLKTNEALFERMRLVRTIDAFAPKPKDLENYYTYYSEVRWGEAKDCQMMRIARDGIQKCKEVINEIKEGSSR